jgi:cyclopropane fatty-acyl-phospholipid synthase-like methyltransferase
MKPYSESCEQNRAPILEVLRVELGGRERLLEVGSGTGQHAVYFAPEFPGLSWQTSDVAAMHAGIRAWLEEDGSTNILPPLALDVCRDSWPSVQYDAVYSANTVHIMGWPEVECLFAGIGRVLQSGGVFCLYGPFNYEGGYTSTSNARFDEWLKARDPASGIKDFEALQDLAERAGMALKKDYAMPANNRILAWLKHR